MKRSHVYMLLVDLLLVVISTIIAIYIRENLELTTERTRYLGAYLVITLIVSAPVLLICGINRSIWRLSGMADHTRVVLAVAVIVIGVVVVGFFMNRLDGVARSLPFLQGMVMVFSMIGARVLVRQRDVLRRRGVRVLAATPAARKDWETILLVGLDVITELYLQSVEEFAVDRIRVAGVLGRSDRHTGRLVRQHRVLGTPEQIARVLQTLEVHGVVVDRIVVTSPFARLSKRAQEALIEIERTSNIKLDLFAERACFSMEEERPHGSAFSARTQDDGAVFSFEPDALKALAQQRYWAFKRVVDFVGAACLGLILFPVTMLAAVLVAIDVGPHVIFWQERPGLGGHPFKLYKLCTMRPGYDENGRRLSDDERLSGIGRLLRRLRLDEFPQLYNVLVGEMSLVGPRPLLPADQSAACGARLLVRPGLTGWAQVQGGRDITPMDKAALDIWYVRNASLALDFKIICRTVLTMLFGEQVNHKAIRSAWLELQREKICITPEQVAE